MTGDPEDVADELRDWISGEEFSCLGAKAAVRTGTLVVARPGELGSASTTRLLHAEISRFVAERLSATENFATLVAVFDGPSDLTEEAHEVRVWRQLSLLLRLDRELGHRWSPEVSRDPTDGAFGLSICEHPFFVVGMHSGASRLSRRFRLPALAFNSHRQFDRLRASGTYGGLKSKIRRRETRLQGSTNPMQGDFDDVSEAQQYAGRAVQPGWVCPFAVD